MVIEKLSANTTAIAKQTGGGKNDNDGRYSKDNSAQEIVEDVSQRNHVRSTSDQLDKVTGEASRATSLNLLNENEQSNVNDNISDDVDNIELSKGTSNTSIEEHAKGEQLTDSSDMIKDSDSAVSIKTGENNGSLIGDESSRSVKNEKSIKDGLSESSSAVTLDSDGSKNDKKGKKAKKSWFGK